MTDLQYLELETHDAVALVRFNRPEVLNALCAGLMEELARVIDDLDADPDIAAIVLSGVIRPVRGLSSLGTFSIVIDSRAESASTSIVWVLRVTVGSAQISSIVRSGPMPARLSAAATLTLAGKPRAPSRAVPRKMTEGSVTAARSIPFSARNGAPISPLGGLRVTI